MADSKNAVEVNFEMQGASDFGVCHHFIIPFIKHIADKKIYSKQTFCIELQKRFIK